MIRDLLAEREAQTRQWDLDAKRKAARAKSLRLIWWLGIAPFLALAAVMWHESIYMGAYIRGWTAGHSGQSLEQGLRNSDNRLPSDQTSTP